ncbi:hypothetical protein POM88_040547 [Heracleum sosnowskyi]|uniref:RNase H type-1 domain-containing protein n=1 Tax=Heracleum sosnowskyi TaxID=360622 RepID=A0AAD8HDE2_9APIA|nr:hypothetical protein POM88_040547 [Heracleum sosnowskyi]
MLNCLIKLARKYGVKKVILESDCEVVVITRLTNTSTYFADLDSLLKDVLAISSSFECICWSHVKRNANFVAHHLASFVLFGVEQVSENYCPEFVSDYVLLDKLSLI